ncbi:MAG: alkaline phosphatase family protein [Elusimicrobiota bacterium]
MTLPGKKVLIIGWDCAAPRLVFDRFRDKLPNVKNILETGFWGRMRTVIPPITIPAWRCMVTGKTPGELGLWGFRHRSGNSYSDFSITTTYDLKKDAVWDIIGKKGMKSVCSAVPPSYPVQPINGHMIGCFMTPDTNKKYTYPEEFKDEIEKLVGKYPVDTVFRTDDKAAIRDSAFDMTDKHFRVLEHLLKNKEWDFAMHVEIGLDRIQHAFWRYIDETHHLYEADSEFQSVILDYYRLLDRWLGRMMEIIDDDTLLLVVSDHGAKGMKGAFCVNQWLAEIGYLKFRKKPVPGQRIQDADIDWKKTKAWAWGGYYSRIFFNIKGREEKGRIKQGKSAVEIEKLKKTIKELKGPGGEKWNTSVYTPDEIYPEASGKKPELMVFWDDLYWRSAGTVGHDTMYLRENDTGPDDGVHDWNGIIMGYRKGWNRNVQLEDTSILDIFPTVLRFLETESGFNGKGRIIEEVFND